jgi:alkaline phosphatase D
MRVQLILKLLCLLAVLTAPVICQEETLTRIGFGSCVNQRIPQPIWSSVYAQRPQLFLMLGDNVYADTYDLEKLAEEYERQWNHPDFQLVRETCPIVGVWDDHDYGLNDDGRENPVKEGAKKLLLEFFDEPIGSPRWDHQGVYTSYLYGREPNRVQIIMLDTRYNRSPLSKLPTTEAEELNQATGKGPYLASPEPAEVLGEEQWNWLEAEFRKPAEIRLLCSSIPVIQEDTGWETWENFPAERERLYRLIRSTEANGLILLTGDSHRGEFSRVDDLLGYRLWEVNSSGLTENPKSRPPNKNRIGTMFTEDNFGMILIDWSLDDPQVTLELRDVDNDLVRQSFIRLSELGFR